MNTEKVKEGGESVLVRANPAAPASLRSFGRRGINTIVFSHEPNAPSFYSRFCDERVIVPSPFDDLDGYRDALFTLAARDDVLTVIPTTEEGVFVLSKYRDTFAECVTPLWPPFETLEVVHDRIRLVQAAEKAGVPVPESKLFDEVTEWSGELIVKPRFPILTPDRVDTVPAGNAIHPGTVIYLEPDIEPDRASMYSRFKHDPIVQEYVPGEEFALWALYDRGEVVATCHKRQVRGRSYAGGTSVYRETMWDPQLEETGRALLDHLEWHGLASVQFIRNENSGEYTLLEINPRAWISISCPTRAGVDFPYYFWQLAKGRTVQPETDYTKGIGTHRLGGELLYLKSVLTDTNPNVDPPPLGSAMRAVTASLLDQPGFDYLSLSDPQPFARDVLRKARAVVRRK